MKNNKFSIIADESTDRSWTKANQNVKDYFLALIAVQETTGAAIFSHIKNFFLKYDIPYKQNCIGFASDGANNMMGNQNSVTSRLREEIPTFLSWNVMGDY